MTSKKNDSSPDILRMTKRHYRELLTLLPEGVGITDLSENLVFVNDAFANIIGYTVEELRGMSVFEFVSEDDADKLRKESSERQAGISSAYELKLIRKDGKPITVRVSAVPWKNEKDEIIGAIAVLIDITKEKLAEQELQKLSLAVEQSPTSVVITDANALIEYVNPRFSVLTGYSPDETIGKNPRILKSGLTPEDTYSELWKTLKEGRAWRGRFINKKKNGELYWEDAWISPIFDLNRLVTHYVAVKEDITQRITAEQRAAQSHRDLELYASFLQHDIRNDLHVVMNHVEAALLLMKSDGSAKEYLETADAASERIVHLLDIFGRPGAADDRNILEILEKVKSQAEKTHSNLTVNIATETTDAELRSARLIPIVFDNLLRNSAEYSEGDVEVTIELSRNGENIQILLSDDGPGIAKEIRQKLFQKGTSTSGSGYGLYLSKKVIEGYGGSIDLLPQDKGTSYRILLPVTGHA